MAGFIDLDIQAGEIHRLSAEWGATESMTRAALRSTLGKMASWLRVRSQRALAGELQVTQKVIRRRLRTFRLHKSGGEMRVWYGLDPISLKDLGARQTSKGVRAGKHFVKGAFIAREHAFKRKGKSRLPIKKQTLEIRDKAVVFIEDEMLGTDDFDKQFLKTFEHELSWRMQKQK